MQPVVVRRVINKKKSTPKDKCLLKKRSPPKTCEHGKRKSRCIKCGGSALCIHGLRKSRCAKCDGSEMCIHKRQRANCPLCDGSNTCHHGKQKNACKICNKNKYVCDYCDECYASNSSLTRHYNTIIHKKTFIATFKECFDEDISFYEAAKMGYQ